MSKLTDKDFPYGVCSRCGGSGGYWQVTSSSTGLGTFRQVTSAIPTSRAHYCRACAQTRLDELDRAAGPAGASR